MAQKRTILGLLGVTAFLAALLLQVLPSQHASAAQITTRSLTLQAGATDGGSKASGVVRHLFTFTLPSSTNVGSIKFQYCTTAADVAPATCVMPTGLVTTSATLTSQNGATGFSIVNTTNGAPYITRPAAAANGAVSYQLSNITNPDGTSCGLASPATPNCTFFVRISTYASIDTTGSTTDTGTVTASTATQIVLDGIMPESLVFCTGGSIGTNVGGVPDCSTASSGAISFDRLFSPTDTAITSSQMAASTNAGSGYAITVNGTTLTSGSNTVTAMGTATTGVHGVSQFGMNLKANTVATSNPAIGIEVAPAANGVNYRGQAYINGAANYGTVDNFEFNSGDTVANSGNGGLAGTDAQIFTVSYIVNVPGSQPAGTYTTTLTYICTPTF
jgi:hypothetical protein